MQNKNSKTRKKILIAVIIMAAAAVMFLVFNRTYITWGLPKDITRPKTEITLAVGITANPGGDIPTQIPTITPTALTGMDSPSFCMIEMNMLYTKARELGGGMLTPDSYEQGDKTCVYGIRDAQMMAEIGHLSVIHKEGAGYGVQVEINNRSGKRRDDQLQLWGTASLIALKKEISQEEAENAVRKALEEGSSSLNDYDLSVKDQPLIGTTVISITDRTMN